MGFFSDIWNSLLDLLAVVLRSYESIFSFAGDYSWAIAIILLTVTVRILLIPLFVRQTKSMRGMQEIQPKVKRIQEKYKHADSTMRSTDPEKYRKLKEQERSEQMALYSEHGVNPVGGCLPLILQMPIFLALFRVLQDAERLPGLTDAPFFDIPHLADSAQDALTSPETLGITGIVLILLQVGSTFLTQKQMQARNTATGDQANIQKTLMYVMPAFLGWLSFTFPTGVVLYWVTTNFWTMGQQGFMHRQLEAEKEQAEEERREKRKEEKANAPARKAQRAAEARKEKEESAAGTAPATDERRQSGKKPKTSKEPSTASGVSGTADQSADLAAGSGTDRDGAGNGSGNGKGAGNGTGGKGGGSSAGSNGQNGSTRSSSRSRNRDGSRRTQSRRSSKRSG